MIATVSRRNV